jgi:hypothetical protein
VTPSPADSDPAKPPARSTPIPAAVSPRPSIDLGTPVDFADTAIRPAYSALPEAVRRHISGALGSDPVEVAIAGGGFTTGFAARIRAASGASAFVKAAGPLTPEVRDVYRMEARYTAALPSNVPAPKVLFHADIDDWAVTGFEALQGEPFSLPLKPETLDLMLRAWADAAEAINPPPPAWIAAGIRPKTAANLSCFQAVAAGDLSPFELPPALTGRWDALAQIESGIDRLLVSDQTTHGDLRPDNMVIGDRQAWICDWAKPRRLPPWIDTVCFLTIAHGDGHDADRLFRSHPTAEGVSGGALDTLLAALTGALLQAWPDAPARIVSPAIRRHMRWNGLAAADWLARRRGW